MKLFWLYGYRLLLCNFRLNRLLKALYKPAIANSDAQIRLYNGKCDKNVSKKVNAEDER